MKGRQLPAFDPNSRFPNLAFPRMDPLSITVSALAIIAAIKGTLSVLKELKGTPKELHELSLEISDLGLVLEHVETSLRSFKSNDLLREQDGSQSVRLKGMVQRATVALEEVAVVIDHILSPRCKKNGENSNLSGPGRGNRQTTTTSLTTSNEKFVFAEKDNSVKADGVPKIKLMAYRKSLGKLRSLRESLKNMKLNLTLILAVANIVHTKSIAETLHGLHSNTSESALSHKRFQSECTNSLIYHGHLMQDVRGQIELISSKMTFPELSLVEEESESVQDLRNSEDPESEDSDGSDCYTLVPEYPEGEEKRRLLDDPDYIPYTDTKKGRAPRAFRESRVLCDWGCNCSCHKHHTFITAGTLNPVFGSFSVDVILPKLISGPCNQLTCRKRSFPSGQIDYVFPSWLIMAMVSAKIAIPSLNALHISIKAARIVPDSALIFRYATDGNLDGIKELFSKGLASPYDVDQGTGTSPLVVTLPTPFLQTITNSQKYATDRGHVKIWRFLLEAGADPYLETNVKHSPLDVACTKIYTANTKHSETAGLQQTTLATLAAFTADFDIGEYLEARPFPLLHKIILNIVDADLETQLRLDTSQINAMDYQGRTALAWAAIRGDTESLTLLLQHGADPNQRAFNGDAPLHYAVRAQVPGCVEPLIRWGAEINARNAWKVTPLCLTAMNRDDIRYLLPLIEAKAELDLCDKHGRTGLIRAITLNRPNIVRCLLEKGARLVDSDVWGCQPLITAIERGFHQVTQVLLEFNSGFLTRQQMTSVLNAANACGDVKTVKTLESMMSRLVD